jgi:cytochrome c peroxidase
MQFAGRPHLAGLIGKIAALAGAMALLLGAGGSIFGAGQPDLRALRDMYRRPSAIQYPKDDPYSRAKYELGRTLFFDPILSGANVRSCSTCHNPGLSWADGQPLAIGENQKPLSTGLRTPTLLNVAWTPKLGWDGHVSDLEGFALGPLTSPEIMNLPEKAMLDRLSTIPGYARAFDAAFGKGDITTPRVEQALATFERSIVSQEAPFDRWIKGDPNAIDVAAKRGFTLFNGAANCAACHSGWAFTDVSFHDIGVAKDDDIGRGRLFPTSVKLQHAFKTPTLRDVTRRGPYMHDGSLATLDDVIDLYNRGGIDRPSRDDQIHRLNLSESDKSDLIAFLETLNGKSEQVPVPVLPRGLREPQVSDHLWQRTANQAKAHDQQHSANGLKHLYMGWKAFGDVGDRAADHHADKTGKAEH